MNWNPPDPYASLILSIGGGVLAGIVVILLEWGWRGFYGWYQGRKAVKAVGTFFLEWETAINSVEPLDHPVRGDQISIEVLQFVKHKYYLWRSQIVLSRWAKQLSDEQIQEVSTLVAGHEHSVVGILPEGRVLPQQMYDRFFLDARSISWLKF